MINLTTIQLLEPDATTPLLIDPESSAPSVQEGGILPLVAAQTVYNILFLASKLSTNYDFIESDVSSTDSNPLSILPIMTLRTVAGFRVILDAAPDTANYIFNWRVRVVSL